MKKLVLAMLLASVHANAQIGQTDDLKKSLQTENKDTVAWIHSGSFTLGANEGFLHNWAAGGEVASLVVNGVFHGNITHLNHADVWSNTLDLAYGLNYAYSNAFIPRKTDDRIDFTSQYGKLMKGSKEYFFAGLFNLRSQFTKGYDYTLPDWQHTPTSNHFSPAYFTLAAGMEYRKGSGISIFLSPIAAREVIANRIYTSLNKAGAFGIDSGKTSAFQFGAYFSGKFSFPLTKTIQYNTRLDLYCNYLAKDTKDAAGNITKHDNPGNIQVFYDNLLTIKAYKSLTLAFGLTLAYDNNVPFSKTYVDPKSGLTVDKNQPGEDMGWLQVKQIFTVGISYKL